MPLDRLPTFDPAELARPYRSLPRPRTGTHGLGNSSWLFTDNGVFDYVGTLTDISNNAKNTIDPLEYDDTLCYIWTTPDARTTDCVELAAAWELELTDWIGVPPGGSWATSDEMVGGRNYHCISGARNNGFQATNIHTARTTLVLDGYDCAVLILAQDYGTDPYTEDDAQGFLTDVLGQISR